MTTEVIVANRECLVVAADSAATFRRKKIFGSAQKIFPLSRESSIVFIVFGTPEILGVRFSVLLARFKAIFGGQEFGTVEECAATFLQFLRDDRSLILQEAENQWVVGALEAWLRERIKPGIESKIQAMGRSPDFSEIATFVKEVIAEMTAIMLKFPSIPKPNAIIIDRSMLESIPRFSEIVNEFAEMYYISEQEKQQLYDFIALFLGKDNILSDVAMNVAIVGMGKDEYYPVVTLVAVESRFKGILRFKQPTVDKITILNPSYMTFLAQGDVAMRFLEGIGPEFEKGLKGKIEKNLENENEEIKNVFRIALQDAISQTKQESWRPILDSLAAMSPDDMIRISRAMVEMTILRRKYSAEEIETVGEPILLCMISKDKGFRWIQSPNYEL